MYTFWLKIYHSSIFFSFLVITSIGCSKTPTDELGYSVSWQKQDLLFEDSGTKDWNQKWLLDGTKATVEYRDDGLYFEAGPDWKNDTSHAVLWAKETFEGNLLIEFDYTRTDHETRGVNIIYFHATGKGDHEYPEDVFEWSDKRVVPTMSTYFRNMKAYHISYAVGNSNEEGTSDYVRLRKYEATHRLRGTEISPDNYHTGLFRTGITYHIAVSKFNDMIQMYVENRSNPKERSLFTWYISNDPNYNKGRIAIRHMYTRGAIYKNFEVWAIQ